jgi:hypothetical protein
MRGFEFDEISVGIEFISEDPCQRDYLDIWCLPDDLEGSSIIDALIFLIGSLFEFLTISAIVAPSKTSEVVATTSPYVYKQLHIPQVEREQAIQRSFLQQPPTNSQEGP